MKYAIKYVDKDMTFWVRQVVVNGDPISQASTEKAIRLLFADKGRARAICRLMRRENECPYVVVRVKA